MEKKLDLARKYLVSHEDRGVSMERNNGGEGRGGVMLEGGLGEMGRREVEYGRGRAGQR